MNKFDSSKCTREHECLEYCEGDCLGNNEPLAYFTPSWIVKNYGEAAWSRVCGYKVWNLTRQAAIRNEDEEFAIPLHDAEQLDII